MEEVIFRFSIVWISLHIILFFVEWYGHTFTITLRHYFYDEYDWEDEKITDIIEIRI